MIGLTAIQREFVDQLNDGNPSREMGPSYQEAADLLVAQGRGTWVPLEDDPCFERFHLTADGELAWRIDQAIRRAG